MRVSKKPLTIIISYLIFNTLYINHSYAEDTDAIDTQELSPIKVTANRYEKIFNIPKAVSYRESDVLGQDLDTILRTVPGTFTQHDIGQGGIGINIRGLEGFGRVNTTIDGVSQTFYQTNPAHGWNGSTTYVDSNFLQGIDIERGSTSGSESVNALGGVVAFRTIDVDDLVTPEQSFGARSIWRSGTNGYGNNGMQAFAYRHNLANGGRVGLLGAFALKKKYGYKNGAGETIASTDFDSNIAMESGLKSHSGLFKVEYYPNRYHQLTLSHMLNRSQFTNNHNPIQVDTQTSLFKYRYHPLSDWLDIRADIAYSNGKQTFLNKPQTSTSLVNRTTHNPALSINIQNTSIIDFEHSDLHWTIGGKILRNRYQSDHQDNMLINGQQNIRGLFTDITWQNKLWLVGIGLNYEQYNMQGYLPPTDDNGAIIFPKGGNIHFNPKEQHLNPRFNIAFKPTQWLQIFANIGYSSRSPNVQEFMYVNNVADNPYSINPYLRGESSFNRDIGFNIHHHGLFKADDSVFLKLNYFNNRIKNYIVQTQFYLCQNHQLYKCTLDEYLNHSAGTAHDTVGIYLNEPGTTHIRGWEIEGGYDMGRAYAKFSLSRSKTDIPHDYLADMGFSHIRTMPSLIWTLDLGTRWLDNKLTIGTRISYTGKDQIAGGQDFDTDKQITETLQANPKLIDIYAIYQMKKNLHIFFNIDNVTNRIYNYPLSGGTLGTGNVGNNPNDWANRGTGRGRTLYGGIMWQF